MEPVRRLPGSRIMSMVTSLNAGMGPVSSLFFAVNTFSFGAWSAHSDGMFPMSLQPSAMNTSISLGLFASALYGPGI